MYCLIEFLSDEYQNKLRSISHNYSERFEDVIDSYGKLFVLHKKLCTKKCHDRTCRYKDMCAEYYAILKSIKNKEIEDFFSDIRTCYINWIDAKPEHSLTRLNTLMTTYKMFDFSVYLDKNITYFKGRRSVDALSRYDMFHVPFNKRYLISNQRYSLTGQPIVYIGKSVIDVVKELGVTDLTNFKISYIKCNKDLKLFDGRNNLFEKITEFNLNSLFSNYINIYSKELFFKNILISICSFTRRNICKDSSFCEEYVLPQLLSQLLKESKFNGITYTSTKDYSDIDVASKIILGNTEVVDSIYKENIALFTNYDNKAIYDELLFSDIHISNPMSASPNIDLSIKDILEMKDKVLYVTKKQEKTTFVEQNVQTFLRIFEHMKINKSSFEETSIGKLHIHLLYNALNDILTI